MSFAVIVLDTSIVEETLLPFTTSDVESSATPPSPLERSLLVELVDKIFELSDSKTSSLIEKL